MLNPELFKIGERGLGYSPQLTELAYRLEIVTEKYPESSLTRAFYIASLSQDAGVIGSALKHPSEMVRFGALSNKDLTPTMELLASEPLAHYAFAYNQSTSSEILEMIAMSTKTKNGVVKALIDIHPNKTSEIAALYVLSQDEEEYEFDDSSYDYFWDAMGNETGAIDLDAMRALTYLDLLNVVEVPGSNDSFWYDAILDIEPSGLKELYEFYADMPQDASAFYPDLSVMRSWAAQFLTDSATLERLSQDEETVSSGVGGFYFADSRSPRSCVVMNEHVSAELVRRIYEEEIAQEDFDSYLNGVLWRIACQGPQDVAEDLLSLIIDGAIKDELTINNLLVGEPGDFPSALHNNPNLSAKSREVVMQMIKDRELSIDQYL